MTRDLSIDLRRLDVLADERRQAVEDLERAHRAALTEALGILEASGGLVRVTELAKRTGVNRATIYNELARRQAERDRQATNGAPAPQPHDQDTPPHD